MLVSSVAACNEILGLSEGGCLTCSESLDTCYEGFCPIDPMLCPGVKPAWFNARDCLCGPCEVGMPGHDPPCAPGMCGGDVEMSDSCRICFQEHHDQDPACDNQRNGCRGE